MKTRLAVLLLALCVLICAFCITSAAEDFDPSTMTWSAYQALSSAEKTAFFYSFPNAAAFNEWRKAAQDAEKPDSTIIGSGGDFSILPPHQHCVCGGTCTTGNHVHGSEVTWNPIVQSNVSDMTRAFSDGAEHYYYLVEDVSVSEQIVVGDSVSAGVHIDLNGHTLTSSVPLFSIRNGTASVCDCLGTGSVLVNPAAASAYGAFVSWDTVSSGASDFSLYSGTVRYAPGAAAAANGLIYCSNSGTVRIFGGTLDGNGCTSSVGGGLVTCDSLASELIVYAGTFQNGRSAVSGGAICCDSTFTFDRLSVCFIDNTAPVGENIKISLPQGTTTNLVGQDLLAGTEIDLCGGTLRISGSTVLDLAVVSSVDCGKIVFDDQIDEDDMRSIISSVAEKNLHLPTAQRCLPIRSGERTYTVCRLHPSGGIWCPKVLKDADTAGKYKFRMMPRFLSQTAYDLLASCSEEDMIAVGFTISAKFDDKTVCISNNGELSEQLSCEYTYDNCKAFFSGQKDTQVFYFNVTGIHSGYKVNVQPYIKVGGQIVYQASSVPECAVLDLTNG